MNLAAMAVRVSARAAAQSPAASDVGHATFYGTCAGLIIAVLVVLYFGEKIIPTDQHPQAVIYLGAVVGALLTLPVLALAGFVSDDFRTRLAVSAGTFLFLVWAFSVVARNWGHEDGRRQAESALPRPSPIWDASAILPPPESIAAVLTERERAAQVFAAAAHVIRQFNPDITVSLIASGQLQQEADRQARVAEQWMRVEPALMAVSAGYPASAVRTQVAAFHAAAVDVMKRSSELMAAARKELAHEERAKRAETAEDALTSLAAEWGKLVNSLHPDDPDVPVQASAPDPRVRVARNGRAAANARRRATRFHGVPRNRTRKVPPKHLRGDADQTYRGATRPRKD
jgi:hypothetical protein